MTDLESAFKPQEYSFDSSGDDDPENDLFFTTNLLNHLESKFCVNTRRIYATGLGMGGGMMHQLACHTHLSRRIGAFAAVGSASFKVEQLDRLWGQCLLGRRPIPVLQIHGEEDEFICPQQRQNVEVQKPLASRGMAPEVAKVE